MWKIYYTLFLKWDLNQNGLLHKFTSAWWCYTVPIANRCFAPEIWETASQTPLVYLLFAHLGIFTVLEGTVRPHLLVRIWLNGIVMSQKANVESTPLDPDLFASLRLSGDGFSSLVTCCVSKTERCTWCWRAGGGGGGGDRGTACGHRGKIFKVYFFSFLELESPMVPSGKTEFYSYR